MKGLEEEISIEGYSKVGYDRLEELEERLQEEIREVAYQTEGYTLFVGGKWFQTLNKCINFAK